MNSSVKSDSLFVIFHSSALFTSETLRYVTEIFFPKVFFYENLSTKLCNTQAEGSECN